MEFIEKTRELKSTSNYIKNKTTGVVFRTCVLYLGVLDSVDNYIESTEEEYIHYLNDLEEKNNQDRRSCTL